MFKVGVTTSMDQRVDQDIVRLANRSSDGSSEVKIQATEMTLTDKMRGNSDTVLLYSNPQVEP